MEVKKVTIHNRIFLAIIVLAIIRGTFYIFLVPPWLAPDESAHFEAIRLIGQEKVWPTEEVYRVTPMHPEMPVSFEKFRVWQISTLTPPQGDFSNKPYIYYRPFRKEAGGVIISGNYPLIYHTLLSPVSALSKHLGIVEQLYLLRFCSLILLIFTVVVAWFFATTIFPESIAPAVAISSFLVFLPMYMHIGTAVNTDILTTLFASLYFLMLAKIFCEKPAIFKVVTAGAFLVLAILTKPTALFILPVSVVAIIIYLARKFKWPSPLLALLLVTIVISTFLFAVVLFQVSAGGRGVSTLFFSAKATNLDTNYFSQLSVTDYIHTVRWGFRSFWGLFGWAAKPIAPSWEWLLWRICILISVGVVIFFIKQVINIKGKSSNLNYFQRDILLVLMLSLIFAVTGVYAAIIATQSTIWGPQSRYFFPALLPFVLYFFLGFQQLVPSRIYHLTLPVWMTGLIFFDSLVITLILIPYFYG